eukprot:GHRR01000489.1.p1 GENE.GHRR01000489.1~~GHRR01000489.1.p1  ORF type:complete len:172 (+),score=30.07 GHRR01000489.1:196-711(+)
MAIASVITLLYTSLYTTFAYMIPGYQTFKAIERKGTEDVRQWSIYWAVLATFYTLQWVIDFALCWLPFYYIFKLGFLLALWHPSTQLALTLYSKVFSPLVQTYEADIDMLYHDTKAKAADLLGQHTSSLKAQARNWSGQATVLLKNVQQKALDRAKAAKGDAGVGHGLHTE